MLIKSLMAETKRGCLRQSRKIYFFLRWMQELVRVSLSKLTFWKTTLWRRKIFAYLTSRKIQRAIFVTSNEMQKNLRNLRENRGCVEDNIIDCLSFVSLPLVSLNFQHNVSVELVEATWFMTIDESIRVNIIVHSCVE